jgi:hypothetical protein
MEGKKIITQNSIIQKYRWQAWKLKKDQNCGSVFGYTSAVKA